MWYNLSQVSLFICVIAHPVSRLYITEKCLERFTSPEDQSGKGRCSLSSEEASWQKVNSAKREITTHKKKITPQIRLSYIFLNMNWRGHIPDSIAMLLYDLKLYWVSSSLENTDFTVLGNSRKKGIKDLTFHKLLFHLLTSDVLLNDKQNCKYLLIGTDNKSNSDLLHSTVSLRTRKKFVQEVMMDDHSDRDPVNVLLL